MTEKTEKNEPKLIWTVIYYWPYIFIVLINNIHQHLGHTHTHHQQFDTDLVFLIKGDSLMFYLLDNNGKWLPNSHSRFSPNHLSINVPIRCFCVVEFFFNSFVNKSNCIQATDWWLIHTRQMDSVLFCWRMNFRMFIQLLIVNCLIWFTRIKNAPFIWWTNRIMWSCYNFIGILLLNYSIFMELWTALNKWFDWKLFWTNWFWNKNSNRWPTSSTEYQFESKESNWRNDQCFS